MKTIASLLIFLCAGISSFAQTEVLNRFDDKGKKHGKWTVYLDATWKEVNDSSKALYYRYTYYDHGENIYPMGGVKKNFTLQSSSGKPKPTPGKPHLLDGEYKWLGKDGNVFSIHQLKQGEYIYCKEFFASGKLSQHFEYTKQFKGEAHTYAISVYDKVGQRKQYCMRKGPHGWLFYPCSDDDF